MTLAHDLRDDLPGIPVRRCDRCGALLCTPQRCPACSPVRRWGATQRFAYAGTLDALREPLHVGAVAEKTGVNFRTAETRLSTLRKNGLVVADPVTHLWRLAP